MTADRRPSAADRRAPGTDRPSPAADRPSPAADRPAPVLIACAHGTRSVAGRRAVAELCRDVAALRPGLQVRAAFVDVQRPALPEVVARVAAQGRPAVVVPLLLSAGYHVHVDVRRAVTAQPGLLVAADALGPDPLLAEVLAQRLAAAGPGQPDRVLPSAAALPSAASPPVALPSAASPPAASPPAAQPSAELPSAALASVVLAAAGSSDPRALADVRRVARQLSQRLDRPVRVGYLSAAAPAVAEVLGAAVAERAGPVAVATYLLAPGFFADRLAAVAAEAGGAWVSAPLAPHPLLARLVLARYDQAREQGGVPLTAR